MLGKLLDYLQKNLGRSENKGLGGFAAPDSRAKRPIEVEVEGRVEAAETTVSTWEFSLLGPTAPPDPFQKVFPMCRAPDRLLRAAPHTSGTEETAQAGPLEFPVRQCTC